jgi:uncharacterized protein
LKTLASILILFFSISAQAQSYTVETVPNTKLVNNSYISNPDNIINEHTVGQLNTLLSNLEKQTSAQVAVVLLTSINDSDIFDFAQELFVKWGIGQKDKDNGLLILFVLDQRTIRFHTGHGIEGVLPDVVCKHIQEESMVPYFREGNYDQGILTGVEKIVTILNNPDEAQAVAKVANAAPLYLYNFLITFSLLALVIGYIMSDKEKFVKNSTTLALHISKPYWIFLYVMLPAGILAGSYFLSVSALTLVLCAYGYGVFALVEKFIRLNNQIRPFKQNKQYRNLYNFYLKQKEEWLAGAIFFPVPIAFVYMMFKRQLTSFRDTARPCKKCNAMIPSKLTELVEDEFLQAGQITEEKIGTVDYDVWKCNQCNSLEILHYPGSSSSYTTCPKCNALTYHLGSKRTIQSATYESQGHGESERNCLHCGHQYIETFILPMLIMSTASDNDSSGGGSSSDSSSDSGGSWGGGDSGGGGSSSSW